MNLWQKRVYDGQYWRWGKKSTRDAAVFFDGTQESQLGRGELHWIHCPEVDGKLDRGFATAASRLAKTGQESLSGAQYPAPVQTNRGTLKGGVRERHPSRCGMHVRSKYRLEADEAIEFGVGLQRSSEVGKPGLPKAAWCPLSP